MTKKGINVLLALGIGYLTVSYNIVLSYALQFSYDLYM